MLTDRWEHLDSSWSPNTRVRARPVPHCLRSAPRVFDIISKEQGKMGFHLCADFQLADLFLTNRFAVGGCPRKIRVHAGTRDWALAFMVDLVCCCSHVRSLSICLSVCVHSRRRAPPEHQPPPSLLLTRLPSSPSRPIAVFNPPTAGPPFSTSSTCRLGPVPHLSSHAPHPPGTAFIQPPLHPPPCKVRYNRIVTRTPTHPTRARPGQRAPLQAAWGQGEGTGGEGRRGTKGRLLP